MTSSTTQPCYELVYNTNEYSLGSYGGIVTPEVVIKPNHVWDCQLVSVAPFFNQDITFCSSLFHPGHRKAGSWGESSPWEGGESEEGEEVSHLWDEGGYIIMMVIEVVIVHVLLGNGTTVTEWMLVLNGHLQSYPEDSVTVGDLHYHKVEWLETKP